MEYIAREDAVILLKKYNQDPFHLQHAYTVEAVMKWFAKELGYGEDEEYWGIVGLLHDIDFELFPEEHCIKAPELLRESGVGEDIIHAVCSHGYGITVGCGATIDIEPVHEMEKVLFATDELTGLIWAAALMRPSKSTKDMELKSLKKKYKSKGFAAGCSREVIERGAEQLGWELDQLLSMTLEAMKATEDDVVSQEQKTDTQDLTEKFEFRSILEEEANQAVSIEQICFPPNEACSEKHMKERISKAPELFLVAVDKTTGKLAGFLNGLSTSECKFRDEFFTDSNLYEPDGKNVMLLGLDVLPEYRNQGLGREIMSQYLRRERENHRRMLILTCLQSKVKMYQKMGFQDEGISASSWGGEEWHEMSRVIEL